MRTEERFQVVDITRRVEELVRKSGLSDGLAVIWEPHTTAAVAVNEADADLWTDIIEVIKRLVPVGGDYRHNAKYSGVPREQNAHAHIMNCLIGPGISIPVSEGRLVLGTWQSVLFIEMDGPRTRKVRVHVYGE